VWGPKELVTSEPISVFLFLSFDLWCKSIGRETGIIRWGM
jgi:hypothetical protein